MAQLDTSSSASASRSLEFTPTWVVAGVCSVIILISVCAERGLHRLGKWLKHKRQDALFQALQKLKEELMLLGFISLVLTVLQSAISRICIPIHLANHMLPCDINLFLEAHDINPPRRRLLSSQITSNHCHKGTVPVLSLEGLHQLHIFIFVLALVHVLFCASTMVLGGARIRQWKYWEESISSEVSKTEKASSGVITNVHAHHHRQFFEDRTKGLRTKLAIVSWTVSFFKQFYGSVTKSDYIALRYGFIKAHCPSLPKFDFHKYMMRTLEVDFKKVVGISWYLWLFVVLFLLMDVQGWHTYFWLSFLPLILLLIVGGKLEHIISCLAEEVGLGAHQVEVKPSDKHFWFGRPSIVLYLIHFILFQNSFEIAFFFWILSTYGFNSCIMEKLGYIVPRLIMGVIVQVLCSYSTLPLYALVTQMGSMFKQGMFDEQTEMILRSWGDRSGGGRSLAGDGLMHRMDQVSAPPISTSQQPMLVISSPTYL